MGDIATCLALGATEYVNPPGGTELYESGAFSARGLGLSFVVPQIPEYRQFGSPFVPNLSVVDVLMFNGVGGCRQMLHCHAMQCT